MACSDAVSAGPIVSAYNDRWNSWDTIANNAVDATQDILDDIASQFASRSLAYATYNNVSIDDPLEISLESISFEAPVFTIPNGITNIAIDEVAAVNLPEDTFRDAPTPIVISPPTKPTVPSVTVPTAAPSVSAVTIPDAPVITIPDVPSFTSLDLPNVPDVSFDGLPVISVPNLDAIPDVANFDYTDPTYTSELEQPLIDKILEWLLGGTGLPDYIWNAIWDRGRTNEAETAFKAIQEATEEFAARGFALPTGALANRIAEARQRNQDADNTLNREIAIKQAEMEVENIRFAMQQGIALEEQLKQFFYEYAKRLLDAAKYTVQAGNEIRNAIIAKFTAEISAYKTQVEANNLLIQQELAELDAYKAELEGQRIKAEINRLEVEVFNARIQALLAEVQIYRGQLEGVNAQVEVDKTRIEAFSATVEAASEQIKAGALQFDAFRTEMEAEKMRGEVYESQVRGYAAEIGAKASQNEILIQNQQSAIKTQELRLRRIETDARRFIAELGAEEAETRAYVAGVQAEAAVVTANAGIQESNLRSYSAIQGLRLADAKNEADVGVANAQMFLQNAQVEAAQAAQTIQYVASTQAAIAASALSAVNMSSSLSSSSSESYSYDTTC